MNEYTLKINYKTGYYLSLAFLVASLPLSKFTMSAFQFATLGFWLWHKVDTQYLNEFIIQGKFCYNKLFRFIGISIKQVFIALVEKFKDFFKNKPALIITSLLILHVVGLVYTSDFNYALKDLRTKLPLFILPLFLSTGPKISQKQFFYILGLYVLAVLSGTIYQLILFLNAQQANVYAINAHISHIRFSLNAVLAIYIMLYFVFTNHLPRTIYKLLLCIPICWIIVFLYYFNFKTGIALIPITFALLCIVLISKIKNTIIKYTALGSLIVLLIFTIFTSVKWVKSIVNIPKADFSKLDIYTKNGNLYTHDTINFKTQNGKWVGLYICNDEMYAAWNKRSSAPLDSTDPNGYIQKYTLIKYLASKDLRKDENGVNQLNNQDIINIENGINNVNYASRKTIKNHIEELYTSWQIYRTQNYPNANTLIQRFEYWRTSILIIKKNPIIGVGTGDIPQAFTTQYNEMNSQLSDQYRFRSHNQFISITIGFGIVGLCWFIFVLLYPGIKTKGFNDYFYLVYWIIFIISMLFEDTIESQEGVTYFALLTSLFLLSRNNLGNTPLQDILPKKKKNNTPSTTNHSTPKK